MPTILDTIVEFEDKAIELVSNAQAPVVEYVGKAAEAIAPRLPEGRPSLPVNPAEIVESQFAFAQKVLDAQHKFVKAVLDAAAPVLGTTAKPKVARATKAA